jgi:hypothetical protein
MTNGLSIPLRVVANVVTAIADGHLEKHFGIAGIAPMAGGCATRFYLLFDLLRRGPWVRVPGGSPPKSNNSAAIAATGVHTYDKSIGQAEKTF